MPREFGSGKSQGNGPKSGIAAAQQNNLPVLYACCNLFFVRDVHGQFGLINVLLFYVLPAISSGKFLDFFCLE